MGINTHQLNSDEFIDLADVLVQAQHRMLEASFTAEQTACMLDQIGVLRFVIEDDGAVSHVSEMLEEHFGGEQESRRILGKLILDFPTCRKLQQYGLLNDIVFDLHGEVPRRFAKLSAVLLDPSSILFFGDWYDSQDDVLESMREIHQGLVLIDEQGKVLGASASVDKIWHMHPAAFRGVRVSDWAAKQYCNLPLTMEKISSLAADSRRTEIILNPRRLEQKRYSLLGVYPIEGSDVGVKYVLALVDITAIRQSEEHIYQLAFYDALTGLPNRAHLMEQLEIAVSNAKRAGYRMAVLFLDLDRFKQVNDSMGHDAGDELLKIIGQRIKETLRKGDFAARLGGGEFCIIVHHLENVMAVEQFAQRLWRTLAKLAEVHGQKVFPGCSIGIVICPDDAELPGTLLKMADTAMYAAKKLPQAHIAYYSGNMSKLVESRLDLEIRLQKALQEGEFVLHYQPQVEILTGKMVGVEALIR